jgi:hypothetical protein
MFFHVPVMLVIPGYLLRNLAIILQYVCGTEIMIQKGLMQPIAGCVKNRFLLQFPVGKQ